MDRINKIINPPWLESFRRLEKQMQIPSLAFLESDAIRSIRQLGESTRLASLGFRESELIKSARILSEHTRLASQAFHDSEAMQSIRQLTKSSQLASLALKESEALWSFKSLAESTRITALAFQQSDLAKQLHGLSETSQLASIALKQSEAFNQISQLNNLSSFKKLASLKNSPFAESSALAFSSEISVSEVTDQSLLEIDAQISKELSSESDFNLLSEKTQRILLYLYHSYFLPIILGCLSAYMMTNAVEAKKELESVSTPAEARAFTRMPSGKLDYSALKGFRVTTGDLLHFRESPSMNSEVITLLPVGTLVEVIDKSHRSWLLVEVEINGLLEHGWISRRYTAYFK